MTDSNKEREMYNRMRYLVFSLYVGEKAQKYEKARKFIDFLCEKHFKGLLGEDGERKMAAGLTAELKFFHVLKDKLSLVPTLDAGCRHDFIGRLMEEVVHIDVTKNLDFKEPADSDAVFAEVHDSNLGFRSQAATFVRVERLAIHYPRWQIASGMNLSSASLSKHILQMSILQSTEGLS